MPESGATRQGGRATPDSWLRAPPNLPHTLQACPCLGAASRRRTPTLLPASRSGWPPATHNRYRVQSEQQSLYTLLTPQSTPQTRALTSRFLYGLGRRPVTIALELRAPQSVL